MESSPTPSDNLDPTGNHSNNETLRIGAFNIQVFGVTKASKPEVMDVLADIIRTCNVIAIQEIRDASQTTLPALVDLVNADGSQYSYVVSERLGRTISKEQYAYIFNTNTVELTSTPHTYPEPQALIRFIESLTSHLSGHWAATLMLHLSPSIPTPMKPQRRSTDLVRWLNIPRARTLDEMDFIVMGDLNADGAYFDEDGGSTLSGSEYYWVIDNSADTTTKSTDYTYDRIIITDSALSDFTGDSGVFRFDIEYGLSGDETVAVSDHYPVYADIWCERDIMD